ncbi:MAG: hypothetical protein ABIG65_02565 [Patescibacteria group bacterium]
MLSKRCLKRTSKHSRRKTVDQNRRLFLKWRPFNFCDRFCERCGEYQNDCSVYLNDLDFKVKCQIEGKDSDDPKIIFDHVGQMFSQTIEILREIMKERGIEITKEDEKQSAREEEAERRVAEKSLLFKKARYFSRSASNFLDKFQAVATDDLLIDYIQQELEEFSRYCCLVFAKADRAIFSKISEEKYRIKSSRSDSAISAALGYYSLLACQKSLESIKNLAANNNDQALRLNRILKISEEAEKEFEKKFPLVKNYKNKIIFHGRI